MIEKIHKRKRLNPDEALESLKKFCAYQERSHSEVRNRLIEHQVYGDTLDTIVAELITENFLNEERFARSFARGKFRIKKWGKTKIVLELKKRKVSDYCIKKAMTEIDEEEYLQCAISLLVKKKDSLKEGDKYKLRKKLTSYMIQKGYEYAAINEAIRIIEN